MVGLPGGLVSRVMYQYIGTLDHVAFGAVAKVVPKYTSLVDPAARRTGADRVAK